MTVSKLVVDAARELARRSLVIGREGNISARTGERMLISASGTALASLQPQDLVEVDLNTGRAAGGGTPSSEWRLHAGIYHRRSDLAAVIHLHSTHATALACTGRGLPAFHYMVAAAGGSDIPCVDYAIFGSEMLAGWVAAAFERRNACLIANHGQVAAGADVDAALALAMLVEELAHQYAEALQMGSVQLLDATEMRAVAERLHHYGYRNPSAGG